MRVLLFPLHYSLLHSRVGSQKPLIYHGSLISIFSVKGVQSHLNLFEILAIVTGIMPLVMLPCNNNFIIFLQSTMGDCKSNFAFALGCLCKCMRNKSRLAAILFPCHAIFTSLQESGLIFTYVEIILRVKMAKKT